MRHATLARKKELVMTSKRLRKSLFGRAAALTSTLLLGLTLLVQSAQAQTFAVIHNFVGGPGDGQNPTAGLAIDRSGNLYGTTEGGGSDGAGAVFKLSHKGAGWTLNLLYSFSGGNDGLGPNARVTVGPNGSLYGTTSFGGKFRVGTVFNVRPPVTACRTALCGWEETPLHQFEDYPSDGAEPFGGVVSDRAGNFYGTTSYGGAFGVGVVYELTPSNGSWAENVLCSFRSVNDGATPKGDLTFDQVGNLYGTT